MPRKRKPGEKPKPVSDAQRAEDEKLRESLRTADLRVLDKAIPKAIRVRRDVAS